MAFVHWLNAMLGMYAHGGAAALLAPFAAWEHSDHAAASLLRRFAEVIASQLSRA